MCAPPLYMISCLYAYSDIPAQPVIAVAFYLEQASSPVCMSVLFQSLKNKDHCKVKYAAVYLLLVVPLL
jgi:hypothetical protein